MIRSSKLIDLSDGYVLLVRNKRGIYGLPGGKALPKEKPIQTLRREIEEELPGVRLGTVRRWRNPPRLKKKRTTYYFAKTAGPLTVGQEINRGVRVRQWWRLRLSRSTRSALELLASRGYSMSSRFFCYSAFMKQIKSPASFIGVAGKGIISFGSGQPDLPPPKEIFKNLQSPRLFKYGLIQGEEDLREALAKEYLWARPEDFVVTNGASEALDLVFRAIHQMHGPVDVLLCRPYYYSYPPGVELAGLHPVYTDLREGKIDLKDFEKKLRQVKAVLINSPSNPTGRVEDLATLRAIEKLCQKRGIYIISDEVYKDLIYERENYLIKGRHVITINSFSKTYSMCGLRVGYLYARDPKIIEAVISIKIHTSMNTNILGQEMALRAMKVPRSFVAKQTDIWRERRDYIHGGLVAMGFDLWKPEGAFYVLPKIKNSGRVVTELFYKHNVIVYDGAWFGAPGRIRLSYALELSKIKEGLSRIKKYLRGKEDWLR